MVNKTISPQRWFSAWRLGERPAPDTDPADLGTAFGLDLSLVEISTEPPPAAPRRAGWVRRLTTRGRNANAA